MKGQQRRVEHLQFYNHAAVCDQVRNEDADFLTFMENREANFPVYLDTGYLQFKGKRSLVDRLGEAIKPPPAPWP